MSAGTTAFLPGPRRRALGDAAFAIACWAAALVVLGAFGWIVADLLLRGAGSLSLDFLVAEPLDAGRAGGIGTILVSTLLILATCLAVSVPLGVATAALLAEVTRREGRLARAVRASLDLLAAVPSIVFGLFGSAFFCRFLGLGFSILAGGLTLACMVLPIVIRATEEGFRAVPDAWRQGAYALGLSRTAALRRVLLPAALPGLVVGIVLGVGRALAETAALIFTSGYVTRMPESLLDSGRALSIHVYDLSMNVPGGENSAAGAALVLLAALLVIDGGAAWLADRWLRARRAA